MKAVLDIGREIAVPDKYYSSFGRVFSPIVLESLIDSCSSKYLFEILTNSGMISQLNLDMTVREFLDWLYNDMSRHYRNEYVYKNAIANKILLGRHSLNTSYMLTEFRVGSCRADVVILNGTSNVYEIKSEYDSLNRIKSQVESYVNVFDLVNVIAKYSQVERVCSELPGEIGLLELSRNYAIKTIRGAVSLKSRVKPEIIFDSLWKKEYLGILKKHFGEIPDVPNTQIFDECKKLFCRLTPEVAHDEMVKVLKQRGNRKVLKDIFSDIPSSLSAYVIDRGLDHKKAEKLNRVLAKKLRDVMVLTH